VYPNDGHDVETLLMNADAAMYRAKEMGKNNCQFYTREMNASIEEKLVLLEGLRNALDDGQFRLVYQPKVDSSPAACSAWRRWCAGIIRSTAPSGRTASSRWPRRAA
jgi:predicted signal transduction protein with EAL and GGDEF domain